jgi:cyclic pyranopterin phosphate synthase
MPLTHLDAEGRPRMVDVGDKPVTARMAVATGEIALGEAALGALRAGAGPKGDVLAVATLAGIMGGRRVADLVPLCHPVPLDGVEVDCALDEAGSRVVVTATARANWRTGVEMEALTAVTVALLTVYDMLKAVDRGLVIGGVRLLRKSGGRSGAWAAD